MSFESLLIHTVGVRTHTEGAADRYGNPAITYGAPVIVSARVEQVRDPRAKEILQDRDTRLTWFRVFFLPTVTVTALDLIEWGSRTFEVDGEPITWYDEFDAHHITAIVREIND